MGEEGGKFTSLSSVFGVNTSVDIVYAAFTMKARRRRREAECSVLMFEVYLAQLCVWDCRGVERGWLTTLDSPFLTTLLTGSLEKKKKKGDVNFSVSSFCFFCILMISATLIHKRNTLFGKKHTKEKNTKWKSYARIWRTAFTAYLVILWGVICDAKGRMLSFKTEWWKQLLGLGTRSILRVSTARYTTAVLAFFAICSHWAEKVFVKSWNYAHFL